MGRRSALAVSAAILAAVVAASTGAAVATPSQEADFVSRINAERSSRGIRTVVVKSDLASVARNWSERMAAAGTISHDPNLPDEISGWTELGDNVGKGTSVAAVHDAFMRSNEHRSIILDSGYNQVGVGVAWAGSYLYVTEIFARRSSSTTNVVRTTTRRTTTRRTNVGSARTEEIVVNLTGVVWELDLGTRPMTVAVLEQLVGLDAKRVDPATGIPA